MKYDVESELANAGSSFSFSNLICGDGEKATNNNRRLLFRDTGVRRSVIVAVATPETRPRRLKVVPTKVNDFDEEALLDSDAVPNLLSLNLCSKMHLRVEQRTVGLIVAKGQYARLVKSVIEVLIFFDYLRISMDTNGTMNPSLDVNFGIPVFERL